MRNNACSRESGFFHLALGAAGEAGKGERVAVQFLRDSAKA